MGELLLCHEPIASLPYYVEKAGMNLYSMEELCYYIAGNTYLLDKTFMQEELCTWIEKQMGLYQLAGQLRDIMRSRGLLSDFAAAILKQTSYLEDLQVQEILQGLRQMEEKSEFERGKIRADRLVQQGKYLGAIYEYKRLLDSTDAGGQSALLLGNIWHNLGTAYARQFLFAEAGNCYEKAYHLNHRGESLREALMCCLLQQDEASFSEKADENCLDETSCLEIRNELALAETGDEMEAFLARLKNLRSQLDSPEKSEAKRAVTDIIFQWKEAYRRSCKV